MNLIPLMLACQLTFSAEPAFDPFEGPSVNVNRGDSCYDRLRVKGNIVFKSGEGHTWSIIDGNLKRVSRFLTHSSFIRFDGQNIIFRNDNLKYMHQAPDGTKTKLFEWPIPIPDEPGKFFEGVCDWDVNDEYVVYAPDKIVEGSQEEIEANFSLPFEPGKVFVREIFLFHIHEGPHINITPDIKELEIKDNNGTLWKPVWLKCILTFHQNEIYIEYFLKNDNNMETSAIGKITIEPSVKVALMHAENLDGPYKVKSIETFIGPPKTSFFGLTIAP